MKDFEKLTIYCECHSPESQFTLVRDPEDWKSGCKFI